MYKNVGFGISLVALMLLLAAISTIGVVLAGPDQSTLKLYVFDCGMIRFNNIDFFSISNDETEIRDLIVPCYVIEHDKGRLLWDGGLPSETAKTEGWHGEGMLLRLDRTLNDQLVEIDLDMSSFDYMAFSHMHFDHVGVANEVKGATLIIQKAEYEAAFADPPTLPGARPSLYNKLEDTKQILIEGDYDVFGDGRVRILSAPGHTSGHQVLFTDLANTGPIVLSGDLYHFALSRKDRRVPTFNVDAEASLKSMDRVEAFLVETGAELWIEHELAWFKQLKKSPENYD
jgi:glyoxylase-like metal-dependent hydrolase (beta-lactamase superfamily II)